MNRMYLTYGIYLALFYLVNTVLAQETLVKELQPLQQFVGKTWKGEFVDPTTEAQKVDISHWERALNGTAIRVLHSINNGIYGGESIIFWDKKQESIVYYYFTTAGFFTNGTMKIEDDKLISHEYVSNNENGITEVKSISTVLPDGRLHGKSQYFQDGNWIDGHEIYYVEDPRAQVVFK